MGLDTVFERYLISDILGTDPAPEDGQVNRRREQRSSLRGEIWSRHQYHLKDRTYAILAKHHGRDWSQGSYYHLIVPPSAMDELIQTLTDDLKKAEREEDEDAFPTPLRIIEEIKEFHAETDYSKYLVLFASCP